MADSLPPSPPSSDSNDKLLIILSHLSFFLGVGLILPLVVYLIKKQDSPLVADHAREALNFHITALIYGVIGFALCFLFIGFLLLPLLAIAIVVCSIIAAIKASEGGFYKYPMTLRLIS